MTDSQSVLAGWFLDGSGAPVRKNVLINIENGTLASLKECRTVDLNGPGIIDLSHWTILPGLVDAHVHLFMSGTLDQEVRRQQIDTGFADAKKNISRHIEQHLAHGIIAIRDGGDHAGHALRYKTECLPTENIPICLKLAGRAWHAPGRYGRLIGRSPSKGESLAQAVANCGEEIDHIKIVNSGLNSLIEFGKQTAPQFTVDQFKEAVVAAAGLGLKVMVHANGELPVRSAIEAGCHSIEHGFFMGRDNLKKMADRQIFWVPTVFTMKAYEESLDTNGPERVIAMKNLDHQMEQISKAIQYGVRIAVGTDSGSLGVYHGSAYKEELRLLMQAGMTLEDTVHCAALNGSKLLGLEKDLGILKPGMSATFIAVKGEPAGPPESLLSRPEIIFIQGSLWKSGAEKKETVEGEAKTYESKPN